MSESVPIRVTKRFNEPPERVYQAWLDPTTVGQWLFATPEGSMERVEMDPRVSGQFIIVERRGSESAFHAGRFVELHPPRRLVFDFATNPQFEDATRVAVELTEWDTGCDITLEHELPPKYSEYADRTRAGWAAILERLKQTLAKT